MGRSCHGSGADSVRFRCKNNQSSKMASFLSSKYDKNQNDPFSHKDKIEKLYKTKFIRCENVARCSI